MISQANASTIRTAYQNNATETKSPKVDSNVSKNESLSRVDQIKESISAGSYKMDLQAVSEKMADSLL